MKTTNNFLYPFFSSFLLFLFSVIFLFFSCAKSDLRSKNLSPQLLGNSSLLYDYNVTSSLPVGYVKDGSVDYTTYLQYAIDKYDSITFPAFPILINDSGLSLRSNTKLTFMRGSILVLKPSSKANYDVLSIRGSRNIKIFNPVIHGERNTHKSSGGEWGMGIGIYASQNIQIFSPIISDTWGDGIYVGSDGNNIGSANIYIDSASINNVRRNGIGITSVKKITISNSTISHSNGTLPMDGICVEPNSSFDEISGIIINNITTSFNNGYGVEFSLSKIYGGSSKNIDASIFNPVDRGSKSAAYISCYSQQSLKGERVYGSITFTNPRWFNFGQYVWRPYGLQENNLTLTLIKPSLYDSANKIIDQFSTLSILKREIFPGSKTKILFN